MNFHFSKKNTIFKLCKVINLSPMIKNPSLPEMKLPQFTARIFVAYPFLLKGDDNASQLITRWREYKRSVPTYGAIICNKKLTHCILVQVGQTKASR